MSQFFGAGSPTDVNQAQGQSTDQYGNPIGQDWSNFFSGWYGNAPPTQGAGASSGGDGGSQSAGDGGSQSGGQQPQSSSGALTKALEALNPVSSAQAAEQPRQQPVPGSPTSPSWFVPNEQEWAKGNDLLRQAFQQQGGQPIAQVPAAPPGVPSALPTSGQAGNLWSATQSDQPQPAQPQAQPQAPQPAQQADLSGGVWGVPQGWGGQPATTPPAQTASPWGVPVSNLVGPQPAQALPTPEPTTSPTPAQQAAVPPSSIVDPASGYGTAVRGLQTAAATPEPAPKEPPSEPPSDSTPDRRYTSPAYGGSGGRDGQGGMGQVNPIQTIGTMLMDMLFGGPGAMGGDIASLAAAALGLPGYGFGGQQGGQYGNQGSSQGNQTPSDASWLSRGEAAPRDTDPYQYQQASPEQARAIQQAVRNRQPYSPSVPNATISPQFSKNSGETGATPVRPTTASMPSSAPMLPMTDARGMDPFTQAAAGTGGQAYPSAAGARAELAGGTGPMDIRSGAQIAALDKTTTDIESGGRPGVRTGSNYGLGQFSRDQWAKYGLNASNIDDPRAVQRALAMERRDQRPAIMRANGGREPTAAEYYIAHQQGTAGGPALIAAARTNPNVPAWQVINRFYPSPRVAQRAIAGNNPSRTGPNVTAGQFVQMWTNQVNRRLIANAARQNRNLARIQQNQPQVAVQ